MSPKSIIETKGLGMRFGGVEVLRGIDFAISYGELRCLIGPNGAGKSTFFKCVTGQLRPTAGRVTFRGRDVAGLDPFAIARLGIGIKTQVPSVFDGLSVREQVWLAARRRHGERQARRKAGFAPDRIGIAKLAATPAGSIAH